MKISATRARVAVVVAGSFFLSRLICSRDCVHYFYYCENAFKSARMFVRHLKKFNVTSANIGESLTSECVNGCAASDIVRTDLAKKDDLIMF